MALTIVTKQEFAEGYIRAAGYTDAWVKEVAEDAKITEELVRERFLIELNRRYTEYVNEQVNKIRSIEI